MHSIISFVLVTLVLSSSLVSSTDWSKEYTGFCDSHDYYGFRASSDEISSYGIYPGGDEFDFWELAVKLVKDYSGWGEYSKLPKEFSEAVSNRNRVTGTLNFERYMPSLGARTYTEAFRTIRRLIAIDMHQWYYYPDCNSLRRLIGLANKIVNGRQMQLDLGRSRGDSANIISCHEHALGIWDEFRNKLEDLYNEEYLDKGYCNKCGHCINSNERHQSITSKLDDELASHLMGCYICRQMNK